MQLKYYYRRNCGNQCENVINYDIKRTYPIIFFISRRSVSTLKRRLRVGIRIELRCGANKRLPVTDHLILNRHTAGVR